jgi:hypothetical protein
MTKVFVDYNRIGSSTSFRVPLSRAERTGLRVDDVVSLIGDPDMPEQHARVIELTADGYGVLELVTASRRAAG